jgi:hypothetical protein
LAKVGFHHRSKVPCISSEALPNRVGYKFADAAPLERLHLRDRHVPSGLTVCATAGFEAHPAGSQSHACIAKDTPELP